MEKEAFIEREHNFFSEQLASRVYNGFFAYFLSYPVNKKKERSRPPQNDD